MKGQVRNYSTTITAQKTVGEICELLSSNGAQEIALVYDSGHLVGLSFQLVIDNHSRWYRLPIKPQATLERLKKDSRVARTKKTLEQAVRVSWRNVKMWLEAQIEFIKDDQVDFQQIMLPYMMLDEQTTVYDKYRTASLLIKPSN